MQTFQLYKRQFKQQLADNHHRGLVVVAGDWPWCINQLDLCTTDITAASINTLWLGENSQPDTIALKNKQALQWLGQECEQLVINGHDKLDLNALGALTGTVKAGGLCYLLCPAFDDWQAQVPNRLIRHLIDTIRADKHLLLLEQGSGKTPSPNLKSQPPATYLHPVCKTGQQQIAVEKIKKVATGHRRRPLVLTADRGRGKSSALGIALAELLSEGKQKIIISAPQAASVHAVFARAVEQLTVIRQSTTELITEQGNVLFIPPDELIRLKPSADLVMIDEAAAIPAPMLTELLKHHSRIVFTSTIAGYEGTGRGFEIRFKQTLNQLTPSWQTDSMEQPIRWALNDPLEQFINQALMLNAQAAQIDTEPPEQLEFRCWDRDKLLEDKTALSQIIGLLTLSHYKTTPNDFRHLLDGTDIKLYTQSIDGAIVTTALVAIEGNLPDELCQQVWRGERRPKGHLLPQTLSCHAGFEAAPKYRYARVIRIAVHPDLHSKGLGSQLLDKLTTDIKQQNIDFVGSSFGATTRLLRFWQNNEFTTVRLGLTKEATSNEYSAIVLKPLNSAAKQFQATMQHKFDNDLPHQLVEHYPLLPASLVIQLLQQQTVENLPSLTTQEQSDLQGYVDHRREYEFATLALYKLTLLAIAQGHADSLNGQQQQLLVDKVLRRKRWAEVCGELGFTGKKMAANELKQAVAYIAEGKN